MHEQKRILGIDYGSKRVGIAITDPLRLFAYGLTTIQNDLKFWDNFDKILAEYEVEIIILGYPLKESGERSTSTELIEKFHAELKDKVKVPIELVDERYSSSIAQQQVLESVTSKKKRRNKGLIDKNAAAVILQDYLNANQ